MHIKKKKVLVGKRINPPAKGCFFVPGGRIFKSELKKVALRRILKEELGYVIKKHNSRSISELGIYEHFYKDNFMNDRNFTTHYVVIAYLLPFESLKKVKGLKINHQHTKYKWSTHHRNVLFLYVSISDK